MKYEFKNQKHRMILNLMGFSDDQIDKQLEKFNDPSIRRVSFTEDTTVDIWFTRECFKTIQEYNPYEWNPYPEVKPPGTDSYLVTVKADGSKPFARYLTFRFFDGVWNTASDEEVLAFKAKPEIYEPEEDNET